jgi:hypothetical protein
VGAALLAHVQSVAHRRRKLGLARHRPSRRHADEHAAAGRKEAAGDVSPRRRPVLVGRAAEARARGARRREGGAGRGRGGAGPGAGAHAARGAGRCGGGGPERREGRVRRSLRPAHGRAMAPRNLGMC